MLATKIYRTIILPVVLYGCETWSVILREERRLRVFENRVLRRVFGPKRDEVTVRIFVEKVYKMRCLEGSGVPVLYTGRTVPKG
jgi:hypothetical protein